MRRSTASFGEAALGVQISDSKAESIAQALGGGLEIEHVKQMWSGMAAAYSSVGARALDAVGLDEQAQERFFSWARQQHEGKLVDAVSDMVRQGSRSTKALKALGQEYIRSQAGGYSDADLESMPLPQGARFFRESNGGPLMIEIAGWGRTTAQGAIRSGVLKLS